MSTTQVRFQYDLETLYNRGLKHAARGHQERLRFVMKNLAIWPIFITNIDFCLNIFFHFFNVARKTMIWVSCGPRVTMSLRPLLYNMMESELRRLLVEKVSLLSKIWPKGKRSYENIKSKIHFSISKWNVVIVVIRAKNESVQSFEESILWNKLCHKKQIRGHSNNTWHFFDPPPPYVTFHFF